MTYALTWMQKVLTDAGLRVAPVDGWETRGHGDVSATQGVMLHHTVGPRTGNMPSLGVIVNGRADLSGPLCNLGLGRDGTYYLVAAGRGYHAGAGSWHGIITGNSSFIGIEAENTGGADDLPWPPAQMDAYRHGVAALLTYIKAPAIMCCGHKEYALPKGRKIDPSFEMDVFRADISQIMNGTTPARTLIPAADDKGHPTLQRGDKGNDVVTLQKAIGISPADGIFGGGTEAAIREFQRTHPPLVPDGVAGPKTWAAALPAT